MDIENVVFFTLVTDASDNAIASLAARIVPKFETIFPGFVAKSMAVSIVNRRQTGSSAIQLPKGGGYHVVIKRSEPWLLSITVRVRESRELDIAMPPFGSLVEEAVRVVKQEPMFIAQIAGGAAKVCTAGTEVAMYAKHKLYKARGRADVPVGEYLEALSSVLGNDNVIIECGSAYNLPAWWLRFAVFDYRCERLIGNGYGFDSFNTKFKRYGLGISKFPTIVGSLMKVFR